MTTFEYAKEGDKVYDYLMGWGIITEIDRGSRYPIIVDFDDTNIPKFINYTFNGVANVSNEKPTLFWDEVTIKAPSKPKPLPKLEVDAKVLVWDENTEGIKIKRHFSHFNKNGKMECFTAGLSSWVSQNGFTSEWEYWEIPEEGTK